MKSRFDVIPLGTIGLIRSAMAGILVCAVSAATQALVITPTYDDASFTAGGYSVAAVHSAFTFVANEFQSLFTDPIHVNITVRAAPQVLV